MACRVVLIVALALVCAEPARAEIRVVEHLRLADYAGRGAVGLYALERGRTYTARLQFLEKVNELPSFFVYTGATSQRPSRPGGPLPVPFRIGRGKRQQPVVYVEEPRSGDHPTGARYPVAVVGKGFRGVLTSDSTRLRGLVTLDDVLAEDLEWRADDDAVETVERLDDRIERNDDIRLPATVVIVAATIGLALLRRPRPAVRVLLVALAVNLWLSPALAVAAALAAVALPLGPACAAVIAVYLAALGLDAETVALSPLGPSQVGRFYGIDNLTETLLLLPALLGAALLGRRLGVLAAALALVTIAGNRFGADGGGLLVLLAGYAVLAWRFAGRRLTWRSAALAAAAVVLAGLVLVGVDAATGGSSHVTSALGDGPGELAHRLGERAEHSLDRTFADVRAFVVVVLSLGVLVWALRHRGEPVLDALLVALAVSLVVNDTPSDVLSAGAALAVVLVRARDAPERWGVPAREPPG